MTATSSNGDTPSGGSARRWAAAGLLSIIAALVVVLAAQHSSGTGAGGAARPRAASPAASSTVPPHDFAWLRPEKAPEGWHVARLPSGAATLAYPPGWHTLRTDPGTASAALTAPGGTIVSYLNATPQDGAETLADWSSFRPHHVAEEGARRVQLLASAQRLPFRAGHGSCVIDSYSTSKTRYVEIACLVTGPHTGGTVIVAAAQPGAWSSQGAELERAIDGFTT